MASGNQFKCCAGDCYASCSGLFTNDVAGLNASLQAAIFYEKYFRVLRLCRDHSTFWFRVGFLVLICPYVSYPWTIVIACVPTTCELCAFLPSGGQVRVVSLRGERVLDTGGAGLSGLLRRHAPPAGMYSHTPISFI